MEGHLEFPDVGKKFLLVPLGACYKPQENVLAYVCREHKILSKIFSFLHNRIFR